MTAITPQLAERAFAASCAHFVVDPAEARAAKRGVLRRPFPVAAECLRRLAGSKATDAERALGLHKGSIKDAKGFNRTFEASVTAVLGLMGVGPVRAPAPVTADTIARVIVAAARIYGDHPIWAAQKSGHRPRRSIYPAASALAAGSSMSRGKVCRLLVIDSGNLSAARRDGGPKWRKAYAAATAVLEAAGHQGRQASPPVAAAAVAADAIAAMDGPAFGEATSALAAETDAKSPTSVSICGVTQEAKARLLDALDEAKMRTRGEFSHLRIETSEPPPVGAEELAEPASVEPVARPAPVMRTETTIIGRPLRTLAPPVTLEAFKPGKPNGTPKGQPKPIVDPECEIREDAARRKAAGLRFEGEHRPDDSRLIELCNRYGGFPRIVVVAGTPLWLVGSRRWECTEPKPGKAA